LRFRDIHLALGSVGSAFSLCSSVSGDFQWLLGNCGTSRLCSSSTAARGSPLGLVFSAFSPRDMASLLVIRDPRRQSHDDNDFGASAWGSGRKSGRAGRRNMDLVDGEEEANELLATAVPGPGAPRAMSSAKGRESRSTIPDRFARPSLEPGLGSPRPASSHPCYGLSLSPALGWNLLLVVLEPSLLRCSGCAAEGEIGRAGFSSSARPKGSLPSRPSPRLSL